MKQPVQYPKASTYLVLYLRQRETPLKARGLLKPHLQNDELLITTKGTLGFTRKLAEKIIFVNSDFVRLIKQIAFRRRAIAACRMIIRIMRNILVHRAKVKLYTNDN